MLQLVKVTSALVIETPPPCHKQECRGELSSIGATKEMSRKLQMQALTLSCDQSSRNEREVSSMVAVGEISGKDHDSSSLRIYPAHIGASDIPGIFFRAGDGGNVRDASGGSTHIVLRTSKPMS